MTDTYMRDYRVVPADVALPAHDELSATEGEHFAEMAQRELRRRLRDGEVPDVVLASPSRASRAEIEHGGRIPHPVYAWTRYGESDYGYHASACAARLEAESAEPDWQADWAAAGAVLLHDARVIEFYVPIWLGPVADQIEALTGVPVRVQPAPEVAEPIVRPGPASVAKAMFTPEQCAELRDFLDEHSDEGSEILTAPEWAWRTAHDALVRYGARIGLPVTTSYSQINAYEPGECFPAHADADTGLAKALDRTVSIHVPLGRPGEDWHGGEFRAWESDDLSAPSVPVAAGIGDGILYTARTFHEVTEVTHGERYALVVKGEVDR